MDFNFFKIKNIQELQEGKYYYIAHEILGEWEMLVRVNAIKEDTEGIVDHAVNITLMYIIRVAGLNVEYTRPGLDFTLYDLDGYNIYEFIPDEYPEIFI